MDPLGLHLWLIRHPHCGTFQAPPISVEPVPSGGIHCVREYDDRYRDELLFRENRAAGVGHHQRCLPWLDALHLAVQGTPHRAPAIKYTDPRSQYDFSNMGPYLFAGLMGMLITGLVQIFLPFNKTTDLVIACFGVLLFSGYSEFDAEFSTGCADFSSTCR
jgi:hypothetical protein